MSRTTMGAAVLTGVLLVGACGSEDAPRPPGSTDHTTQTLLNAPASQLAPPPPEFETAVPMEQLGFSFGETSAAVRIIEMSDYGCGFCRQFHLETFPTLLEEFVLTGKVQWKFMPFVTGMFENSLVATTAAECVLAQSDGLFVEMSDRLWANQSDWKRGEDPEGVTRAWVVELGADMAAFDTCVAEDERLSRIGSATGVAGQLGVRGTPTFFILGYPPLQGALPTETFRAVLAMVYEAASAASPDGS